MKILSFNCRGLTSPSKKSSLKHLVDVWEPNVLLLQETMGNSNAVVGALKYMLLDWYFAAIDANGRSRGIAYGWQLRVCKCESIWDINFGLGLEVFVPNLGMVVTILNIYGLYQDRVSLWDKVFNNPLLDGCELILAGDLNFSLGSA